MPRSTIKERKGQNHEHGFSRKELQQERIMQTSHTKQSDTEKATKRSWRRVAWILIVLADVGLLAWGAMAALAPDHLLGPGSAPILRAEYEGFTGQSWAEIASASPRIVSFLTLLFRMYGTFNVAFALMAIAIAVTAYRVGDHWAWWALLVGNTLAFVSAMAYDRTVGAIGPFELTEYLGLGAIYLALAITAPWRASVSPKQLQPGK
jgi:hypothetical protein